MDHYAVTAQFGHVGRGKYIPKTVSVYAEDGKKAAEKVRWMPRVKHHRKDAILDVKKITFEEYIKIREINEKDPYFKVRSKKEQKKFCIDIEKMVVCCSKKNKTKKKDREDIVKYKMKKDRIVHLEALNSMRNYEIAFAC